MHVDGIIRIRTFRIRILEGQKLTDPAPEHCNKMIFFAIPVPRLNSHLHRDTVAGEEDGDGAVDCHRQREDQEPSPTQSRSLIVVSLFEIHSTDFKKFQLITEDELCKG